MTGPVISVRAAGGEDDGARSLMPAETPETPKKARAGAKKALATEKAKAAFLAAMASGLSAKGAAQAAGISRATAYRWRAHDADFAQAWDDAEEEGTDRLEDEMFRRAVHGTEKPVFHQGKQCGTIRDYSDTLAIFLAKARRPEKYRERYDHRHDGGVPIDVVEVRADIMRRLAKLASESGA